MSSDAAAEHTAGLGAPRPARRTLWRVALFVVLNLVAIAGLGVVALWVRGPELRSADKTGDEEAAAAESFLDRYVSADGRVVRLDQGGDTVSEGQAYALLFTVAIDDKARFDRVWSWTAKHLQRPDGLLSWHWEHGKVVDPQSAADADIDTAAAFFLAAKQFNDVSYADEARRIAASVVMNETVEHGTVLVAGPWARAGRITDPSYVTPSLLEYLRDETGDDRWGAMAAHARTQLRDLVGTPPYLPPDWAKLSTNGSQAKATVAPDRTKPQYGYDAMRIPIRFGADCSAGGRELAAQTWRFLDGATHNGEQPPAAVYNLHGRPLTTDVHAAATTAAAAAARAAGDDKAADRLLTMAAKEDRTTPTYYGSAAVALGRLLSGDGVLDTCK